MNRSAGSIQQRSEPPCHPQPEVPASQHPQGRPQAIAPDLALALGDAGLAAGHGNGREANAPAAGHNPAHQQGPGHVVAAGDPQHAGWSPSRRNSQVAYSGLLPPLTSRGRPRRLASRAASCSRATSPPSTKINWGGGRGGSHSPRDSQSKPAAPRARGHQRQREPLVGRRRERPGRNWRRRPGPGDRLARDADRSLRGPGPAISPPRSQPLAGKGSAGKWLAGEKQGPGWGSGA